MPRRFRLATGGIAYHVLTRRVGRLPLFEKPGDYHAFEMILGEAFERIKIRIAVYCLKKIAINSRTVKVQQQQSLGVACLRLVSGLLLLAFALSATWVSLHTP